MGLSVGNLLVSIGIAFDSQLKAADNLFFAAAVDFADPTRPLFGGAVGNTAGDTADVYDADATAYASNNNPIAGDPVTVRTISTADGPRYQIADNNGQEISMEKVNNNGTDFRSVPRYMVKSDGFVYDVLVPSNASGTGVWRVADPTAPNGGTGIAEPAINALTLDHYRKPVGRITFKAKEGATLARAQDDLQRSGSIVQLLTRLLESIQDEAKGFASITG